MATPSVIPAEGKLDAAIVLLLMLESIFILVMLAYVKVPNENLPIFASLATAFVATPLAAYFGYKYGSSQSSKTKDATIATMAAQDNTP